MSKVITFIISCTFMRINSSISFSFQRQSVDHKSCSVDKMLKVLPLVRYSLEQLLLSPVPEPMLQEDDGPLVHVPVGHCPEEANKSRTGGDQVRLRHTNWIHSSAHPDQLARATAKKKGNCTNFESFHLFLET